MSRHTWFLLLCMMGVFVGQWGTVVAVKEAPAALKAASARLKELQAEDLVQWASASTYTYRDNEYFVGKAVKGVLQGFGEYTWMQTGRVYRGEWRNSQPHGKGVETVDGTSYDGEWILGHKHGYGTYTDGHGSTYVGQFAASKFNGDGVYRQADGTVFKGTWHAGVLEGPLIRTTSEGVTTRGLWFNGTFEGRVVVEAPTWTFRGQLNEEGRFHGYGVFTVNGSLAYEGSWRNGTYHGLGTVTDADGVSWSGWWRLGRRWAERHDRHYNPSVMRRVLLKEYPGPESPPWTEAPVTHMVAEANLVQDLFQVGAGVSPPFDVWTSYMLPAWLHEEEGDNLILTRFGEVVTPSQTQTTPVLALDPVDGIAYFTLVMVDVDTSLETDASVSGHWLHWLVMNVHVGDEGDVSAQHAVSLAPYIGPIPAKDTGLHRYVMLMFAQHELEPLDVSAEPRWLQTEEGRGGWSLSAFVQRHDLGAPVAITMFRAQWDASVPLVQEFLATKATEASRAGNDDEPLGSEDGVHDEL